jgi:hypothetical protein
MKGIWNKLSKTPQLHEALMEMKSVDVIARTLCANVLPLNAVVNFEGIYGVEKDGRITYKKDTTSTAQSMKAGKWLRRIFPTISQHVTDQEIEKFVNLLKATVDGGEITVNNDFIWAYEENSYKKVSNTLGSSCMNDKCYVDAYTSSPKEEHRQKIACLMLGGKIAARAILWDNAEALIDGSWVKTKIMDRIYYCEDKHIQTVAKWAFDNGYILRDERSYDERESFYDNLEDFNIRKTVGFHAVRVDSEVFKHSCEYPYTDTFHYGDCCYIYNSDCHVDGEYEIYNSTGGGSETGEEYVTDIDGDRYPQDQCRWSEHHQEYIHEDEASYVERRNSGDYGDYFRDSETEWSEYYADTVVTNDCEETEDGLILRDDVVETYNGNYIHKDNAHYTICGEPYSNAELQEGLIVELTAGDNSGEYALEEDTVKLYNGDVCSTDDSYAILEVGEHTGEYALDDDTVDDWRGNLALFDEVSSYDDNYVHPIDEDEYFEAKRIEEEEN